MVSEPPQRALPQRNPLAALNACLRVVGVANGRRSILGFRLYESKLETVFMKVMDKVCGYKGSDAQTTIDTAYNVCPHPHPEHRLIYLYSDRCSIPSPASRLSERDVWDLCTRFVAGTSCFLYRCR